MDLTQQLKKSIEYEQSKTDVMNLMNHKRQDLDVMIEFIEEERKALEHRIQSRQDLLDTAEDLDEGLEVRQRKMQAEERAKLETLLAWRALFLSAWMKATK